MGKEEERSTPPTGNFYRQAARASYVAPMTAWVVAILTMSFKTPAQLGIKLVAESLFILLGLVFGVIALAGLRKHGRKGILAPAIIGLAITVTTLALVFFSIVLMKGVQHRVAEQQEQVALKDEQDARDSFLEFPGWLGAGDAGGMNIVLTTLDEASPTTHMIKGFFRHKKWLLLSAAFGNSNNDQPARVATDTLRILQSDGVDIPCLSALEVVGSAFEDRDKWVQKYSGDLNIPARSTVSTMLFIPADVNPEKITQMIVMINGRQCQVTGRYCSTAEKKEFFELGLKAKAEMSPNTSDESHPIHE